MRHMHRIQIFIIFSIFTACCSRQPMPMLQESDEPDSPAIELPLLRSVPLIPSETQSQPNWVQMDSTLADEAAGNGDGTDPAKPAPTLLDQPDSTGLIGGLMDGRPILSLNLWANQRRTQLKPRRRDMHEGSLMKLLGSDYQPGWMRRSREGVNQEFPPEERPAVRALRQLVKNESILEDLGLPSSLSPEARDIVASWLVKRATCPVRFIWADLGPYFWPRWLRRGECGQSGGDMDDDVIDGRGRSVSSEDDDVEDDDDDYVDALGASLRRNMTDTARSCSWPPGMKCVPGVARTLHLLRWHCRLRKHRNTSYNTILNGPLSAGGKLSTRPGAKSKGNRRQKRSKYRCVWIKVPYSVAEDCVCSV